MFKSSLTFNYYSVVLNNPELLRVNDVIATVQAYDINEPNYPLLNYAIIGPYKDR